MDSPPRKPRKTARAEEWDRYYDLKKEWDEQRRASRRPYDPSLASDDIKAVYNPETGITSNYFGGERQADGPGHGHANIDEDGNVAHPRGGRPAGER